MNIEKSFYDRLAIFYLSRKSIMNVVDNSFTNYLIVILSLHSVFLHEINDRLIYVFLSSGMFHKYIQQYYHSNSGLTCV